jgi:hypothetical protein
MKNELKVTCAEELQIPGTGTYIRKISFSDGASITYDATSSAKSDCRSKDGRDLKHTERAVKMRRVIGDYYAARQLGEL